MKEQLQKLKQQAIRSGFATEMHAHPATAENRYNLVFVLKPLPLRMAKPGEKLPEILDPIARAETLLDDAGLLYGGIRYFDAAKSPAVIVESVSATGVRAPLVGAPPLVDAPPPKTPKNSNKK